MSRHKFDGKVFHTCGPAAMKLLLPYILWVYAVQNVRQIFFITWRLLYVVDDTTSSNSEAKSLYVAYSSIDEQSSGLLHQVTAMKNNVSTHLQADDSAVTTLSVYCFVAVFCSFSSFKCFPGLVWPASVITAEHSVQYCFYHIWI